MFLKLLNEHFRSIGVKSVEWLRVFEWTCGKDGMGHPHFHVWMFSQYLEHALVQDLWRRALARAGCVIDEPIVHIEVVTDGQSAARELIKYMLKDITANGDKIPPDVFARVYEALAERRMRQASKGFMGLAKRAKPCCECGAELPFRVRKEPKASAPKVATK
ncbi:MAG TPA: protein rep [Polyangiaceae bacterium]|nr:protein rep [Polyangiaceae bacterium]